MGQLFFEAVRFSFAVAKIEQKLNTNQIFTQNISQYHPLSCIHFPISKQLTRGENFFILWRERGDSWGQKEVLERGRGPLGGDEGRAGREKLPHTPLPHSIHIGKRDIILYWSAGEPI